jgi:hypothetical protein
VSVPGAWTTLSNDRRDGTVCAADADSERSDHHVTEGPCHSGAIATILKSVVGHDDVDFELDSAVTGQTRTYRHFNDIVNEVHNARIWAGFHYRASTDDGAKMGRRIASHILHHTFQRIDRDTCAH